MKSMPSILLVVTMLCSFLFVPLTTTSAAIIDNFDSYSTGALSVVSGGTWRTWNGTSTDAQVTTGGLSSPNAMTQNGINGPDVVSYSSENLLGSAGKVATFSFDVALNEGPDDVSMLSAVFVGSGDSALNSIDYDSYLAKIIFGYYGGVGAGEMRLRDSNGSSGGGNYGFPTIANLSIGQWHHIDLVATQTVADMTANDPVLADGFFDVFLN